MIETVIFDLGNVIVPFDFTRGYEALRERSGLEVTEIRSRISGLGIVPSYEAGEIATEDFVQRLTASLGCESTVDEFGHLWSSIFEQNTLIPDSLPQRIKQLGLRLLLLSNTNELHFRFIRENFPILRHFDELILSYEVGALKPNPVIFRRAIQSAGCRPEECFFTDDIAEYVAAARATGIDAVQFQGYEQIRRELLARGVNV